MAKRVKVYMTADEVAPLQRMSVGERPDDRYRLVQERDWPAYLKTLESKPMPVTRLDVERLAARFNSR